MEFEGRDIVSMMDLSRKDIEHIFSVAKKMETIVVDRTEKDLLRDKILAAIFFQPSTRTRLSFESAMHRLGGSVLGWASPEVSRAGDAYGETLTDTALMIDKYADVVAMRHSQAGEPAKFAEAANIPVINGGDGYGEGAEHPTQSLLDLYTILNEKGKIDGLKVLLTGDMNQRTHHSLCYGLAKFNEVQVSLFSPPNLRMPKGVKQNLDKLGLSYEEVEEIDSLIDRLDVIYALGPGKSRSELPTEDRFRIDLKRLAKAKKDLIVLHPLPRLDEVSTDLDKTPFAKYFTQPLNGVVIRMALLALVLGKA